eukprot:CAMPEP_0185844762 /NCGR_PEP_ID=MMETSP1354-20130828/880_1 /TAXON_ID=708628 /ORGANISM="Erythrolobus madagascarensis, Strain CCMP3276" /LENGTH=153 /DNA_ID=CAMNT_0028544533 /DNA_START=44 /DNA_END=505 /DNA_ORIENTATION=+
MPSGGAGAGGGSGGRSGLASVGVGSGTSGGASRPGETGAPTGAERAPVPYPFPCSGKSQASWSVSYGATAANDPSPTMVLAVPTHLTAPNRNAAVDGSVRQRSWNGMDTLGFSKTELATVAVRGVIFLSLFAFGSPRGASVMRSAWHHLKHKY